MSGPAEGDKAPDPATYLARIAFWPLRWDPRPLLVAAARAEQKTAKQQPTLHRKLSPRRVRGCWTR